MNVYIVTNYLTIPRYKSFGYDTIINGSLNHFKYVGGNFNMKLDARFSNNFIETDLKIQ